jgi:hypothetical protein
MQNNNKNIVKVDVFKLTLIQNTKEKMNDDKKYKK